jgi:hypothetical protein
VVLVVAQHVLVANKVPSGSHSQVQTVVATEEVLVVAVVDLVADHRAVRDLVADHKVDREDLG